MDKRTLPSNQRDDQIRRTARLLEIVQQIAGSPGRWNRRKLAEYHEISERMIQKDLNLIRYRLGLKLYHDGSAYSFERLPHLPTSTYSFSEALALLISARTAQAFPGVNSSELAAAIARLESIFPDELQPILKEAIKQLPCKAVREHRQTMLSLLHRALAERKQIRVLYATASHKGETKERILEPYHLMPYGRSWQLIAYDHNRDGVLQFKVDRVLEAELLTTQYNIREKFNLDEYLGDNWGLMRGSAKEPEEVVLLFDEFAGQWVSEEYWHKSQQSETLLDGRVRMTFFVGITPEMVGWLLYYGARVYVEQPEWLRKEVWQAHLRAVEMHERV